MSGNGRRIVQHRLSGAAIALAGAAAVLGCVGDYTDTGDAAGAGATAEAELGSAEEAVSACAGDDVKYDFNAFAASLAVAIANELGRWDVTGDFQIINGKLELSATGLLHCNGRCDNISALLRLQDDSAASVPNHSPAVFRGKLTSWYQQQQTKLTELVNNMLYVDKGIFRLKARHSGKYMAVDAGSTAEDAVIEQRGSVSQTGADQWRIILDNGAYKFVNVRSGKCLALSADLNQSWLRMVQKTCSTSTTQRFNFALTKGYYWLITKYSKAVEVDYWKTADDVAIQQSDWNSQNTNQQWTFEPYGTAAHITPTTIATAMYTLTSRKSGKALTVDNGSLASGALLEQATYTPSDDGFNWYVLSNGTKYQFVNRRTNLCMALATDSATSRFAQQPCNATASTQLFELNPTGDGNYVVLTKYGTILQVEGASTREGAYLNQAVSEYADGLGGPWDWDDYKQLILKPIVAGEPHQLTYAYKTADANCGEYNYWYNIAKPNGQPLLAPKDTFVQLIFAGGKQMPTGKDINPFIAQKVAGNLVAIDPTYGLNPDASTTTGSCSSSCVLYSTTSRAGACCSCNGATKTFSRSAFSTSMYLCM
jgi:Ricin-type beta-trefoil lectin domain-like